MQIGQAFQLSLRPPSNFECEPRRERVVTVGEMSACRNLLVPARAEHSPARLCADSCSGWSSGPDRPAATGEE